MADLELTARAGTKSWETATGAQILDDIRAAKARMKEAFPTPHRPFAVACPNCRQMVYSDEDKCWSCEQPLVVI